MSKEINLIVFQYNFTKLAVQQTRAPAPLHTMSPSLCFWSTKKYVWSKQDAQQCMLNGQDANKWGEQPTKFKFKG